MVNQDLNLEIGILVRPRVGLRKVCRGDLGIMSTEMIFKTACHSGECMNKEKRPVSAQEKGHKQIKCKLSVQEKYNSIKPPTLV